jgi:hypothetical protein
MRERVEKSFRSGASVCRLMRACAASVALAVVCHGCAVVAVADAAVTVVAATVSVGAAVVGTTVDVAAAGARVATGSSSGK